MPPSVALLAPDPVAAANLGGCPGGGAVLTEVGGAGGGVGIPSSSYSLPKYSSSCTPGPPLEE